MDCYLIKQEDLSNNRNIAVAKREYIANMAISFAETLKDYKGKISIYTEDKLPSIETMMMVRQAISQTCGIKNENIFIDSRLNARGKGYQTDGIGEKESKTDFQNRVFDAISEIIMTHEENELIVLVVGDEFIKTCQKDDNIHSLIYFGDEKIIDLSKSIGYSFELDKNFELILNEKMILDGLASKKEIEQLRPTKIILDRPVIDKNTGLVEPVYFRYAEQKLKQANSQNGQSQLGE